MRVLGLVWLIVAVMSLTLIAAAQERAGELQGEVVDQQNAVIVGAEVVLISDTDELRTTTTDERGRFLFKRLAFGAYKLRVFASGFGPQEQELTFTKVMLSPRLTITLFPLIKEKVDVPDDATKVGLDPDRAAGAQILTEEQLKLLPDDPDQFATLLQLLATTSGSAPGQAAVTVDGFTNEGRLPPKSAIREVRINSNIFSAEYDKPPYRGGHIDIFTKPGGGAFHGAAFFNFNNSTLNARDVFAPVRAPVTTRRYGLQFGGPIARNRAGFLLDFEARDIKESTTVNAVILDANLQPKSFSANVPTPKLLLVGSARTDWQVNQKHTFIIRYDLNRDSLKNQGVGGFDLPERGYNSNTINHSLRFAETAFLGKSLLNEVRLGLTFRRAIQHPQSTATTLAVLGAFTASGASFREFAQEEWRAELTDNLSLVAGNHSLKFGTQIVGRKVKDKRAEDYNGTFIFGGDLAPQLDAAGNIVFGPTGPMLVNISGLEQYRRTLLGLSGGVPTRFTITRGNPSVKGEQWAFASFIQDEWHVRENVLLSLGLRYEGQTSPRDGMSFGPRFGIGFSPDKKRRWVLRARAGLFYNRIAIALPLETQRLDGQRQQSIALDAPSYPDPFISGSNVNQIPTVRRLAQDLRPPISLQTQIGFERQLPRGWKFDTSYYVSRGWSSLRSRNINAPVLSVNNDPSTAPRPLEVSENILQFESSGKINGQVLFIGLNQSDNKRFNIFSGYLWFNFRTNADHPFLLPQSSYDDKGEWARPIWMARHRVFLVALYNFPFQLRASAELNMAAGTPYDITTGRDSNGDGNFNDRPNLSSIANPDAINTRFGALDPTAINGSLPRNAGTGPTNITLDVNLNRTFTFGRKTGQRDRKYQLTVNIRANNLLNRANLSDVDGVLTSPLFGRANSAGPARRVEVGLRFNF